MKTSLMRYDENGEEYTIKIEVEKEFVARDTLEIESVVDENGDDVILTAEEKDQILAELYDDYQCAIESYYAEGAENGKRDERKEADQLTAWENSRIPHYAR